MIKSVLVGALAVAGLSAGLAAAGTLDDVRERGSLRCGVNERLEGFAKPNGNNEWEGFDVAICRAVAAAVLDDASAVAFVPTDSKTRFDMLSSGEVDVLLRNTTWTFTTDVARGFEFVGISYYDGQGFMVPKGLGLSSAREMSDGKVCVEDGTTSHLNLEDFFRANNVDSTFVLVENDAEAQQKYLDGDCDAYSSDASSLAAARATFATPGDHVLLPEIISKEPLGPLVRQDDSQWADVVRWTLNALIAAEELGITSANIEELAGGTDTPEINRILGTEESFGEALGLDAAWAKRAIMAGGNYGELFEKNVGEATPIGLPRGLNAQWTEGGLLYTPPFR